MFFKQCNVHYQNTRNNHYYRLPSMCKMERKKVVFLTKGLTLGMSLYKKDIDVDKFNTVSVFKKDS